MNIKTKIKYKFLINIIFILLVVISFLPVGKLGLKYLEKDYIIQNTIPNVDNIIVLAGSENLNATDISKKINLNNSSERLISTAKLSIYYPKAKIYFLGGNGNLKKGHIDETDVAKLFFTDIGFDINRINFVNNTRNTIENLKSFKNKNKSNQINILITSAFHMKRSLLIADKLGIKMLPYAVDFRSIGNFSILNYYQRFSVAQNLLSFNTFFREIMGIVAFKLFY